MKNIETLKLSIGDLDRLITIQTVAEVVNAYGELEQTWSTHAEVWAKKGDAITRTRTSEKYSAAKETAFNTITWTIRYLDTVTEKMRISYDSKIYDIISINEIGRNQFHQIDTELRQ